MPVTVSPPTNPTTSATWRNPQRNGPMRQWTDTTNRVVRQKYGADPTSETDGYKVMEAE